MGTMRNFSVKAGFLFLMLSHLPRLSAQNGPDPGRAALFITYAKKAKRAISAQDALLAGNLAGHKYLKDEVEKITDFQKEFNDYLKGQEDILNMAADIYGIYMEVSEALKNLKVVKGIVVRQPANVLAVALSESKNNIYHDIIDTGLNVASDIELLVPFRKDPEKNTKMTQEERLKVIDTLRIKLRSLNRKLRALGRLVCYTTIMDSWYDLKGTGKEYQPKKMGTITRDCLKTWSNHAKKIKY